MKRKLSIRRFSYYLLVVAILTSCIVNGTFAKFTTEDSGGDGARVAKFGIVLDVSGDLFATSYNMKTDTDITVDNGDGTSSVVLDADDSNLPSSYKTVSTGDTISVQASHKYIQNDTETDSLDGTSSYTFNNVVAPGTKNDTGMNISIQGTAETDCVISYDVKMKTIFLKTNEYPYESIYQNKYGMDIPHFKSYTASEHITQYFYCIMVPTKENIIREDNFEEFQNTLYIQEDDGSYSRATEFDETANYYQAEDIAQKGTFDYYMPVIYNLKLKSSLLGIDDYETDSLDKYSNDTTTYGVDYITEGLVGYSLTGIYKHDASGDIWPYQSESTGKSNIINTGEAIDIDLYLSWEWPYEENPNDDTNVNEDDSCDTILGHLMAGQQVYKSADDGDTYALAVEGTDYNLDVEFELTVTIDQVD